MSDGGTGAKVRMADALLRALGGQTVLLRMPVAAVTGDAGEELGLATPEFEDVPLGPAAFRRVLVGNGSRTAAPTSELLVSASAVQAIVGSLAFDSAAVLFRNAAGVLVEGSLLRIVSAGSAEAFGEVYVYRLGLAGANATAV